MPKPVLPPPPPEVSRITGLEHLAPMFRAAVETVLGNTVISQYLAQQAKLTVLEEMQVARRRAA